ncbi:unnamed protein product [Rotaria sp. Silwood1]|nr:unnamed protein product [Rotaria sp. Silwood1]
MAMPNGAVANNQAVESNSDSKHLINKRAGGGNNYNPLLTRCLDTASANATVAAALSITIADAGLGSATARGACLDAIHACLATNTRAAAAARAAGNFLCIGIDTTAAAANIRDANAANIRDANIFNTILLFGLILTCILTCIIAIVIVITFIFTCIDAAGAGVNYTFAGAHARH